MSVDVMKSIVQLAAWLTLWLAGPAFGATTVEYLHTDALGSVVAVSNSAGTVVERREYEPYGRQLKPAMPEDGPAYTGHVSDAATGLSYMQQRYYDPAIGRFLSVDPVTVDSGTGTNFNRYWYANDNPYKFSDPDGRAPCRNDSPNCDSRWKPVRQRQCEIVCLGDGAARASTRGEILRNRAKNYIDDQAALGSGGQDLAHFFADDAVDGAGNIIDGNFSEATRNVAMALVGKKIKALKGVVKALRPRGVPDNWAEQAARKGGHIKYVNPANKHDYVRVKPDGTITQVRNGKAFDASGNQVNLDSPAAHGITPDNFRFIE